MVDKKKEVKIIQTILDLDFDSISINSTITNLWIRAAKKLPYIMLENTMIPSIYAPTHSIGTNIFLSPKWIIQNCFVWDSKDKLFMPDVLTRVERKYKRLDRTWKVQVLYFEKLVSTRRKHNLPQQIKLF